MKHSLLSLVILFFSFAYQLQLNAQCAITPCNGTPAFGLTASTACVNCDIANLGGFTGNNFIGGTTTPAGFCGTVQNNVWFAFAAPGPTVSLMITASNCLGPPGGATGSGLQAEIFGAPDCNATSFFSVSNCWSDGNAGTGTLTANNLNPGEVYYLMIDGWSGDICDFSITVTGPTGPPPPLVAPINIAANDNLCFSTPGLEIANFSVAPIPGATSYNWEISPASAGTIVSVPGENNIDVLLLEAGPMTICVAAENACATGDQYCQTFDIVQVQNEFEIVEYCVGQTAMCAGQLIVDPTIGSTIITTTTPEGCDQMVTCTFLPIITTAPPTENATICAPDDYNFCGAVYNESGFYVGTCVAATAMECDTSKTLDLAVLDPIAVIETPVPVLGCGAGQAVTLNGASSSIATAIGATTTYIWTGPSFCGPEDQFTACVDQPGEYCLTVTHERDEVTCDSTVCVIVTQNAQVPNSPIVNGPDDPCDGDMSIYIVSSGGGPAATSFDVVPPNGEPVTNIDATTFQVDWTGSVGGDLCVAAVNDCGASTPTCIMITVAAGAPSPTLDGPDTACTNSTETYNVTNSDTNTTYTWTAPTGAVINVTGNGETVNIDFGNATTGDVCVTSNNDCGMSMPVCQTVTIQTTPAMPVLASGGLSVCDGVTENYCVNNTGDATTWTWQTPVGDFTDVADCQNLDWTGSTGGQVCVIANNNCGASLPLCFDVTVNPAPTADISGNGAICQNSMQTVDLTITLTGSGPWDVVYNDGTADINLSNITVSPHTLTVGTPGTYTLVSVTDQTPCPGIISGQAQVLDNPAPTVTLSGSGAICQGSTTGVDLAIDLTGTPNWTVQWTVNGAAQADLNITASPFTLNIQETQAGDIELVGVTDGNGCSNAGDGNIINIPINQAPTVSNISTLCNGTSTGYVVTFVINGGDSNSYSVSPNDGNLVNGTFTSNEIPSGSGYSFTIDDANNCNPVTVDDSAVLCNCTTAVGTMDQTVIDECGDGPVIPPYDNTNEVLDNDDELIYILHEGSGISIVNPIIINTVGTSFNFDPSQMNYGTTYYISAVVGNSDGMGGVDLTDNCLAVAQGTPVVFYEIPTATISDDVAVCVGNQGSISVNFTGTGPWNITYDDGDPNTPLETVNGINANPFTLNVNPTITTTYTLDGVSAVNVAVTCDGTVNGMATVTVNTPVVVSNEMTTCNNTGTGYVVSFEITGGDPNSYVVDGGTIAGIITPGNPATFTSNEIPSGQGYSFNVNDANDCGAVTIDEATVTCDCFTEVGTMDLAQIDNCGNGIIAGIYDNTNENLDGDDILLFQLHTSPTTTLGTIIQSSNTSPDFSFDASNMSYGTTYYISAVVGNDDGNGGITTNDPCLAVAQGTPVIWFETPTATLSGDAAICTGASTDLSIALTGAAPWTVTIENDLGFTETVTDISSNPFNYTVNPTANAVYSVTSVSEVNNCDGTIAGSANIQVNEAPITSMPIITFNATNTGYTVSFEISGGDASSYAVVPANGTLTNMAPFTFTSNELPCGSGFNFQVDDGNACGPAIVSQAEVICNCITEAGAMLDTNSDICGNGPITVNYGGGETLDANDVASFVLQDENDVTLLRNTDPSFTFNPTTMNYGQTYFICAAAGDDTGNGIASTNDPCYTVGTVCTEVVFNEIPTATISGSGSICEGDQFDITIDFTGTAPFNLDYVNNTTNDTTQLTGIMDNPFTLSVAPTENTIYTLVSLVDANNCDGTVGGASNISLNTAPIVGQIIEECNDLNTTFTVTFDIFLGDPISYVVTPAGSGTLTNSTFVSNPLPTGSSYEFFIDDANACNPDTVSGAFACNCDTNVGFLITTDSTFCGNVGMANINHAGFNLDMDDNLIYVLHDGTSQPIGNIIATNPTTPEFGFQNGMDFNTTYFIAALIGNDDGNGGVDFADPCFDIVETPVTYFELPTASAQDVARCGPGPVTLDLELTGQGPFTVIINNGLGSVTINNAQDGDTWFNLVTTSTTFVIESIEDVNGCLSTINQNINVTVSEDANAGFVLDEPVFCEDETATVNLDNLLAGADDNGVWSDANGNTVSSSISTADLSIGDNIFTYFIDAVAPCEDDSETVNIRVFEQPLADAGGNQTLNCNQTEVMIGGNPASGNVTYQWSGPGVMDPNSQQTMATQPGIYNLVVTNEDSGCTSSDQIEVTQEQTFPNIDVTITGISCFGDNNGIIRVDSAFNGAPPYEYSFEGGAFSSNTIFPNLSPGDYTIAVRDANGCELELSFNMFQPDELVVELNSNLEGDNNLIQLGDSVILSVEVLNVPFGDIDNVQWQPEGVVCDTCQSNVVYPELESTFSVTVEENGCSDSDQYTIFVEKNLDLYVPNIFSPNGDQLNDLLTIFAKEGVIESVNEFYIFNRWGEAMYSLNNHPVNDISIGWDGTYRGSNEADPGIYVWYAEVLFVDGTKKIFEGDFMLVR